MDSVRDKPNYSAKIDSGDKDVPWYAAELTDISPECRELMENYSRIPPDLVKSHILHIREKAWSISSYPCIGQFHFLHLSISQHPSYPRILSLLKAPQSLLKLLDLGCCFAQDIRKLVHDGVPSENLYACDLRQEFLDLSYDLFADKDTLRSYLFEADIFQDGGALSDIAGGIDFIYAGSFFHLFNWDDQMKICKKIIEVLKPVKGSLVFGRQTGNIRGQEVPKTITGIKDSPTIWRHDPDSFKKMWEIAGQETGTKWHTSAQLDEGEGMMRTHWAEEGIRRLRFEVERLE